MFDIRTKCSHGANTFTIFFINMCLLPPHMQYLRLPTEGAIEVIVIGPATQATGTEDVVAVQKTRLVVLLMTQVTDEWMEPVIVWIPQVIVRKDDSSCHL